MLVKIMPIGSRSCLSLDNWWPSDETANIISRSKEVLVSVGLTDNHRKPQKLLNIFGDWKTN